MAFYNETPQGIRKDIGVTITREELDSIKLIRNRATNALQAMDSRNIVVAPKDASDKDRYISEEQGRIFVKGAIESRAEAQFLEESWWSDMIQKYALVGNVYVDFGTGSLYTLEPADDQPSK
jgi:hypothetical protein